MAVSAVMRSLGIEGTFGCSSRISARIEERTLPREGVKHAVQSHESMIHRDTTGQPKLLKTTTHLAHS